MSIQTPAVARNPKEWDCNDTMRCVERYPGVFTNGVCVRYETITTCCKKPGTDVEASQQMIQRCITTVKKDPKI